jgi:hypothetical protein
MPARQQTKGTCTFCAQVIAKQSVAKHLSACTGYQALVAQAGQKPGASETLYHLRAQDAYNHAFWLDLEMTGSATLQHLDRYLRAIWLECCGHLSQFSIGGWRGEEIAPRRKINTVFQPGIELTHIYDFGTSSETVIKVIATREGTPITKRPIALLARNQMPESRCVECQQPAEWFCHECLIEANIWGTLCDTHAKTHPHDNYGEPVRLVNSPRLGMCGYDGPAEPPY